jgi:hypothetical protein
VRHEDSPYQKFDHVTGKLVGMRRFPIRVLTLTYIPDTAIPPSDTSVSRPQVRELWRVADTDDGAAAEVNAVALGGQVAPRRSGS